MASLRWMIKLTIAALLNISTNSYKIKEVYVSAKEGKDTTTCGESLKTPCRSLDLTFSIYKCSKSLKMTISIDGGNNNTQLSYVMTKIVNITCDSYRMKKYPKSYIRPKITMRSTGRTAFRVSTTINFQSIEFDRLTIVSVPSKGRVEFKDCNFLNSRLLENSRSSYLSISIISSKIFSLHQTPLFIHIKDAKNLKLLIRDSHVHGSGIYISRSSFILSYYNTTFSKFHWTLYGTRTHMNNLKVYDCKFLERSVLKLKSQGRAYLKRNSFISSVTTVQTWKYFHFYHSNFTQNDQLFLLLRDLSFVAFDKSHFFNNTGRGLVMASKLLKLYFKESIFINNHFKQEAKPLGKYTCIGGALCLKTVNFTNIAKSIFINNSGLQGGAIYLWKSQVNINSSIFINNTAYEFGGTLYSEGNKRISMSHTVMKGPPKSRYKPLIGHLLYSKTAMRLKNISFIVKSNLVDSSVIVYIDTVQDVLSKKHTILSSFYLQCPIGYNVQGTFEKQSKQFKYISTNCVPCGKGKYNLNFGYSFKNESEDDIMQRNITCLDCPSGGICNNRIESAGNYWGFVGAKGAVQFIPCPLKYCCTRYGTPCKSYNTCEENRDGRLCGKCKQGFTLDYWSLKCIPNKISKDYYAVLFWIVHCVIAVLYVVILLLYPKEICRWIKCHIIGFDQMKTLLRKICAEIKTFFCTKTLGNDIEEDQVGCSSANTPILNEEELDDENEDMNEEEHLLPQNQENTQIVKYIPLGNVERDKKRFSGLKKIIFLFYQIAALLRVTSSLKSQSYHVTYHYINTLITFVFNIKVSSQTKWFNFSPIKGLNIIQKELLRISFIFTMFLLLLILWFLAWFYVRGTRNTIKKERETAREKGNKNENENVNKENVPADDYLPFYIRVRCSVLKLSLFGYISISVFLFKNLNCVPIGDSNYLYIDGNIACFSWSYWLILLIGSLLVFPYFITLLHSSKLLHARKISPNEFFAALIFPFSIFYLHRWRKEPREFTAEESLAAKRYLMVLYEPYRFNGNDGQNIMWECWVLLFRLSAVVIFTFIINPVTRVYVLIILLLIYLAHHVFQQPYYDRVLNIIETISLMFLILIACINLFWAHDYMGNTSNIPNFKTIGKVFVWLELIILMLPISLVGVFIVLGVVIRLVLLGKWCWTKIKICLHLSGTERTLLINEN